MIKYTKSLHHSEKWKALTSLYNAFFSVFSLTLFLPLSLSVSFSLSLSQTFIQTHCTIYHMKTLSVYHHHVTHYLTIKGAYWISSIIAIAILDFSLLLPI